MNNNIDNFSSEGLCCGCGTCVAICPSNSIEMVIDSRQGLFFPQIRKESCNNCGRCVLVCPGYELDIIGLNQKIFHKIPKNLDLGNFIECFSGYAKNADIRVNSSSGGLVTQILLFALEKKIISGALIVKMKNEDPFEPEPFIARTREEIIAAAGSKYCPVPINILLKEILDSSDEEQFAVVGLPCHIHGIRKMEYINKKLNKKIKFHIGLFCSSTKSFHATDFLLKRIKIQKNEVGKIKYRGAGWPGYLTIEFQNGKIIKIPFFDYFDATFSSFTPWRCMLCIDETGELADISFGDAWLPEIKKTDNKGTSIIIVRDRSCGEILNIMKKNDIINLESIDTIKIIESQGGFLRKKFFNSRKKITKFIFNKPFPDYKDYKIQSQNSLTNLLITIIIYSKFILINNNKLWGLLDIYCNLLKRIEKFSK